MKEREPRKEIINRGELFFLTHPGTENVFSGYGLTVQADSKEFIAGLLMVDRPYPADPAWLRRVEELFGEYQLVPMTASGERGIVCQMQIEPDSLPFLKKLPGQTGAAIQEALTPILEQPPNPAFILRWDEDSRLWRSELAPVGELPEEIREVFERSGYGCLASETNVGVVHVCHAADADIEGFRDKPVVYQWQVIKMPAAPLVRLEIAILDRPQNPYRFESFLNVADEEQAQVLLKLTGQESLHLAFYGDDFRHRFTKSVAHDGQQWQQLDELFEVAVEYWESLPPEQRDFDRAKAEFVRRTS